MIKLLITRHGETQWNVERRMQGQKNSNLTTLGIQQAKWLKDRIKDEKIDYIYSSPLQRAIDTANLIKGDRSIIVNTDDNLKELSLGCWEGVIIEDTKLKYPEVYNNLWMNPEKYIPYDKSAETFSSLCKRTNIFLNNIIKKHSDATILIVTHAIALKSMLVNIQKKEIKNFWDGGKIQPSSLTVIEYSNQNYNIKMIGDVSHHKYFNEKGKWFIDK